MSEHNILGVAKQEAVSCSLIITREMKYCSRRQLLCIVQLLDTSAISSPFAYKFRSPANEGTLRSAKCMAVFTFTFTRLTLTFTFTGVLLYCFLLFVLLLVLKPGSPVSKHLLFNRGERGMLTKRVCGLKRCTQLSCSSFAFPLSTIFSYMRW